MQDTIHDALSALAACGIRPARPTYRGEMSPLFVCDLVVDDESHLFDEVLWSLSLRMLDVFRSRPGPLDRTTTDMIATMADYINTEVQCASADTERG